MSRLEIFPGYNASIVDLYEKIKYEEESILAERDKPTKRKIFVAKNAL